MIFNQSPFRTFSRVLMDGIFNLSHGGEFTPPTPPTGYTFVIDSQNNYLVDKNGNYLVVTQLYYLVDKFNNYLVDKNGNFLTTRLEG